MASAAIYHQQYYEKNKERLRERAREREKRKRILAKAFVKASTRPSAEPASPNSDTDRLQTTITTWAIPPLLLISTFLMIREMTNAYSETWGALGAILIALAVEGFTLLFSFVHAPSTALKIGLRGLAVVLALGSIYGMSANHFSTGLTSYRADQANERSIADLEKAIQRKQSQSDALLAKSYIGAARKLERQIDAMRVELTQLRIGIIHTTPTTAVASTTLFEIFTRLALTICNLFAAHLFGANLKRFENFKMISEIPRIEIGIPRPDNLKFLKLQKPLQTAFQGNRLKAFKEVLGLDTG